jgi:hypothetical protein
MMPIYTVLTALCLLTFFGGVLILLVLVVRKILAEQRRSALPDESPQQPAPRPVPAAAARPRIVTDGFWLHSTNIRPGSTVRYRYRTGGATRIGEVEYEPGPQGLFVYTGDTPNDVEILDTAATGDVGGDWGPDADTGGAPDEVLPVAPAPIAPLDASAPEILPPPSAAEAFSSSEPPAYG